MKYCAASRYRTMIVAEQSAKALSPHSWTCLATNCSLPCDQLVVETLMIPLGMIVSEVLVNRIRQRLFAQHHHMIQGFLFDRAHEPLAMGIQIRTLGRQDNGVHPAVLEEGIKRLRELRVSVVHQVALAPKEPFKAIRELPRALLHESRGGMRGDAGDLDTPGGQLHHNEHVIRDHAVPRGDFHREEVRGREDLPVHLQELRPAHAGLPALRRGFQVVAAEDITHSGRVDGMSQVRQGPLETAITPGRILLRHPHDQLFDPFCDPRAAQRLTLSAPIKLQGDQSLVPPQKGRRGGDGRHLFEALATERDPDADPRDA